MLLIMVFPYSSVGRMNDLDIVSKLLAVHNMYQDINTFASFDSNTLDLVALGEVSGNDHTELFVWGNFLYSRSSKIYRSNSSCLIWRETSKFRS